MANNDEGSAAKGAIEALTAPAKVLQGVLDTLRGTAEALAEPFEKAADGVNDFTKAMGATSGFVGFKDLAIQLDGLAVSLQRATGQGDKFAEMSMGVASGLSSMGVTMAEAAQAAEALFSTFSNFSLKSPDIQRKLIKQATAMKKLGIATEDTAQSQEFMIKALGMTADQAIAINEELAAVALQMGVAPGQMAKDFTKAAPKLAKYGKGSVKVFKQLAAQSKATGIEMGKLISIGEKFDTFEGAAESAGQLNAILGGPLLNSVELMTSNEAERVEMIRRAVNATGRSFESMNRFEKQAIAQASGIGDVSDALRLFGTEQAVLEDIEEKIDPGLKAQQELSKAMNKAVSIAEKFQGAFESLSRAFARELRPVLVEIAEFLTGKEGLGSATGIMKSFANGLRSVVKYFKQLSPQTRGMIKDIAGIILKVGAFGFAMKQVQSIADPLLALLANPWVMIGAGIMLVYKNWEYLSNAFSNGIDGIQGLFVDLDTKIMSLFSQYEDKFPLVKGLKSAYMWIREKIPEALRVMGEMWKKYAEPFIGQFKADIEEKGFLNTIKDRLDPLLSAFSDFVDLSRNIANLITASSNAVNRIQGFGNMLFGDDEHEAFLEQERRKYGGALVGMTKARNRRAMAQSTGLQTSPGSRPVNYALEAASARMTGGASAANGQMAVKTQIIIDRTAVAEAITPGVVENINNANEAGVLKN